MDKITYLAELAEGLARWVPERERQDILRYYAEYFDEAGAEREGEVIAELGDPWALSCRLAVEGGFVTQEKANSWTPRQNRRRIWPLVTVAAVACVAIVAVSVARTAASVGGWFGRLVSGNQVAIADSAEENIGFVTIPQDSGVTCIEDEELIGGFWTMEDGYLDEFTSIDADISLGNVTVTEGDDFTLFIQQSKGLGGYSVQWEIEDNVLKLRDAAAANHVEISNWGDVRNLFTGNTSTVDVTVTVPEGVPLQKVSLKTDLGNIFLGSLWVNEKVEAETSMGDVECYEVRTLNKIDLQTSMGDVTLGIDGLESGVDIDLETSMGQVEANLGCYERDCAYEIRTDMGNVSVNGVSRGSKAEQKGDMPYQLSIGDDMGDVNVYFYMGQKG